jgi:methionyl-tRNA synthetase
MQTNHLIDKTTPWVLAKDLGNPESKELLHRVIFLAAENLRISAILLQPFMPMKAAEVLDAHGVSKNKRTLEYAKPYTDFDYGSPIVPIKKGAWSGIFPQLLEG